MLYNKHRPAKITDLKGQEGVKTFLLKISKDTVPHTLIFYGPSGTGKTTAARLLAKKIFCKNIQEDGDVCGVCPGCKSVDNDNSLDYLEIDATSSGGVDDVRSLKDRLVLNTLSGNRRVVYIDEAHQLSKKAFDALLKVLEEHSNNIFILATTEINKVPKTVRTRALELEFSNADVATLSSVLKELAEKEGYTIDDEAANLIAMSSEGSFRRAVTLFETVMLQIKGKEITVETLNQVPSVFGEEELNVLKAFPRAFARADWVSLLEIISALPEDDKKLRGIGKYMYTVAVNALAKKAKAKKYPTKAELAKMVFISSLGESIGNQAAVVTKPAITKALVDYLRAHHG